MEPASSLTDPASACEKTGSCGLWSKVAVSLSLAAEPIDRITLNPVCIKIPDKLEVLLAQTWT